LRQIPVAESMLLALYLRHHAGTSLGPFSFPLPALPGVFCPAGLDHCESPVANLRSPVHFIDLASLRMSLRVTPHSRFLMLQPAAGFSGCPDILRLFHATFAEVSSLPESSPSGGSLDQLRRSPCLSQSSGYADRWSSGCPESPPFRVTVFESPGRPVSSLER